MAHTKVEKQVIENAQALEQLFVEDFKKKYNGKFVTFFNGVTHFSMNYGNAIAKGKNLFGDDVGYVVRKVTPAGHPTFSSLVKL